MPSATREMATGERVIAQGSSYRDTNARLLGGMLSDF